MDKVIENWDKILQTVKADYDVGDVAFNTWLKPLKVYDVKDNVITILVPSEQVVLINLLNKKYKLLLQVTICEITGMDECEVKFISPDEAPKKEVSSYDNAAAETGLTDIDRRCEEAHLNPKYIFDTFIVGNNNKFAQAAALAVAESPGDTYNPLFIYGGAGLGKTHLMHAIGNYIEEKHKKRVLYVTCDQFLEDFMGLSRKNNVNNNNLDYMEFFKSKYRDIDVLIIDDIQFLGGATASQQEFFHTFNNLHNDSKQIIVSSDRSPDDLKFLEDRLRTRFCWGLQVDIAPPEFELKVAIIRKKLNGEKLKINDDVINFIASNVGNDVRQLEGSITRLVAYSVIMGVNNPTLEFAMEALKEFTKKPSGTDQNNIRRIQKSVANFYKISYEDIKSNKRPPNIAIPRQVAMYLCRKLTNESFERIGIEFGGKNHATVMHSCNKIETSLKSNMELKEAIIHIEQELK